MGATGAPNYAWPSYAPYPNFSAVGYPTAYPWQAWPNISAPYPYPEVPLDWRAVTLRWDDGIWWLDFKKNYTRPFFTPYPFGIFSY
ncbi:BON domain-containing protein, partial [Singulisphaera rosea]